MRQLRISGKDYEILKKHLYLGDDKEAIAFALCGRLKWKEQEHLLVHEVIPVPYEVCEVRERNLIKWPFTFLENMLTKAAKKGFSILKIHSHPSGYEKFSELDDTCDIDVFRSIYGWLDHDHFNASAVMLPDGRIFGRFIYPDLTFKTIDRISSAGDSILLWDYTKDRKFQDFEFRNLQAFGERTIARLKKLKIGIIGCSGTGSPVIEQLVRLGVGELLLIDPDSVEPKNLNRILNTTRKDAKRKIKKVKVLRRRINKIGLGTKIKIGTDNICDSKNELLKLATCDVIFGCTDNMESRHFLNKLSCYFIVPYFDLGVKLVANKDLGIDKIACAVHYLQPKGSSLITRKVYDQDQFEADRSYRKSPDDYARLRKQGYIKNTTVTVESPAVISVNMQIAAIAVNELLNKIDPFKSSSIEKSAIIRMLITDDHFENEGDGEPDPSKIRQCGLGETKTFLGIIGL